MTSRKALYVCLEGLDGSGKSTAFDLVSKELSLIGVAHATCNPTRKIPSNDWIERLFSRFQWMQKSSTWRAIVYARRSNWAALHTDWSKPLVLGDRSIVTSYVTRWRKWLNSPKLSIRAVDFLESAIPAPDLVFYLDAPHELLMERLQSRGYATDIDETPKRSMAMRKAYDEIIVDNLRPSRLVSTRFVIIQVSRGRTPEDIASEIVATIVGDLFGEHYRGCIKRGSISIYTGQRTLG